MASEKELRREHKKLLGRMRDFMQRNQTQSVTTDFIDPGAKKLYIQKFPGEFKRLKKITGMLKMMRDIDLTEKQQKKIKKTPVEQGFIHTQAGLLGEADNKGSKKKSLLSKAFRALEKALSGESVEFKKEKLTRGGPIPKGPEKNGF